MSQANYPIPPPSYGSTPSPTRGDFNEPLLGNARSNAIYEQGEHDDLPDDFKYGTTVSVSAPEIRNAFVRKVYTILFCQILGTCIVSGILSRSPSAIFWVQTHTWSFYVPIFGSLINLGLLYWKRHNHPWNLVLLTTFTLLEAFSLGVVTAFFDNIIVLQALLITLGVFLGLTLFTFQSKYNFEGLGPWLFGSLIALCMTGLVGIFIPFSHTMDLIYAIGGCLIFSGYIVYDTYMIQTRYSPDEFIMGSISLYLDFVNLFLSVLRLLNNVNDN